MKSVLCVVSTSSARVVLGVALLASVALVSGCAKPSASANVYTYGQAQRDQVVRNGTVVNVRPITIQNDHTSGAGVVAGGAVGGVMGSTIGGGTGRTLAVLDAEVHDSANKLVASGRAVFSVAHQDAPTER